MERFLSRPVAQSYPLSAYDMQGSFANIPYAFFFENTDRNDAFMPSELLKKSLGQALQDFPILTGHLRPKARGKIVVEVDPENVNVPEFIESTSTTITFDDIKTAGFAWSAWPDNVITVGGFATPAAGDGEIKLLNVHIVRLKDESGLILFINIPHYPVDGAGYFGFIKTWASTMASMAKGETENGVSTSSKLVMDRSCIQKYLPTEREALDDISHSMYTVSNMFCDTLAYLSPALLGRLLGKLGSLSSGEGHLFRVSQDSLDGLREAVRKYLPEGKRISENDLLVALVSKTYVQSQPQPELKAGWFSAKPEPETHFTVRVPCDARPRLNMKEIYTGNLLIPMLVRDRMENLVKPTTPETIASAALEVRKAIGGVSSALIGQYHDTISEHPTSHMRPLSFAAGHQTTSMVTTSQVRFGLYDVDFGHGSPQFVCLTKLFAGSYTMAAFLPTPPKERGVYILLTSNVVAMKNILENEFWRKTAELVW